MQLSHIQSSHEDHSISLYRYDNNCGQNSSIGCHPDRIRPFSSSDVRRGRVPLTVASKRNYCTAIPTHKFFSTALSSFIPCTLTTTLDNHIPLIGPKSQRQPNFYFRMYPKNVSFFSSVAENTDYDLEEELKKFEDSTLANVMEQNESIFFNDHDKNNDTSQNSVLFDIYQDDHDDDDINNDDKTKQQQTQQNSSFLKIAEKQNMAQIMQRFDPENPPNPETSSLHDLQLWYECESLRDAVIRYEKIIADARSREDYASLTAVQQQLLRWYHPLRQRIEDEQEDVIKGNNSESKNDNKDETSRKTDFHRYGPYLCMLQPEKLAYITAHEATIFALQKGGDSATLLAMALRIGDAVEAEVNVLQNGSHLHQITEFRLNKNIIIVIEGL